MPHPAPAPETLHDLLRQALAGFFPAAPDLVALIDRLEAAQ